jgi:hypothetical protein
MKKSVLFRCLTLCMILCTVLGCLTAATVGAAAEVKTAVDLDNDAGSLTYTVSEDGSTVTITYLVNGETVSYTVPNSNNYTAGGLVGTDDLGRKLYTTADEGIVSIGSKEGEHNVGLFYFLWHGEHGDNGVYDLQKILDEQGAEVAGSISKSGKYGPVGAMHWFAEPLYGYYYANDEWVHRKHAELLTLANVDFLYFDVTNGFYYLNNALSVMKALHELNEQGFDAPQVVFYTHSGATNVVQGLYKNIYSQGLYEDTWYRIDGKPVIVAPYESNINDFFTIKREQWPNESSNLNGWPWMDFNWPARIFRGLDADGEKNGLNAISVSVAQHSGNVVFSTSSLYGYAGNRGRSFNASKQTDETLQAAWEAVQNDPTLSYQGLNFQAQWDQAIKKDPAYVLVTGWNEWVAQRQPGSMVGNDDKVAFVDTASIEYSRDTEMMRGGYFDNYYMQLAFNIQRYKGTAPIIVQDSRKQIDVTGDFSQWDSVQITYHDLQGDTQARNGQGFGHTTYTNDTGRNDIIAAKVTSDTKNLYFYVETADEISYFDTSSTWMQLFLNVDSDTTGWYGYDYIVNYSPSDTGNTTVAKYVGDGTTFDFANCAEVSYKIDGNKMMITVPQSALGIGENHYRELCLQFKWVDSSSYITTMEQFYEDGDCAPLGRMNFVYQNYIPGVSEVTYPELETEPETETETEPDTVTETDAAVQSDADADTTAAETEAPSEGCASSAAAAAILPLTGLCCGAVLTIGRRRRKD